MLEADIAKTLGISRGPVREAIKAVEQAGIVTVEPRKGAFVAIFDNDKINEVFEIRILLETSIIEYLIVHKKLVESDFAALNKLVEEMVEIAGGGEDSNEVLLALNKKDIEFHRYIWQKSKNQLKKRILDDLYFRLRLAMLHDTKATKNLLKTATDHFAIIKGLREGDIGRCRQALIDHIESIFTLGQMLV